MTPPDYVQRLFVAHLEVLTSLALVNQPGEGRTKHECKATAAVKLDTLIRLVEKEFRYDPTEREAECARTIIAFTYRSLERTLALTARMNSGLSSNHGAPFTALLRDGYRILNERFDDHVVQERCHPPSKDAIPPEVTAGIVADNLTVLHDLNKYQPPPLLPPMLPPKPDNSDAITACEVRWGSANAKIETYLKSRGEMPLPQSELLTARNFWEALRWSEKTLKDKEGAEKVLVLTSWDGSRCYPAMQIVADEIPEKLGKLLKEVNFNETFSRWHLAVWLSQPFIGEDDRAIDVLDTRFDDVTGDLHRYRVLKEYSGSSAIPRVPTLKKFQDAKNNKLGSVIGEKQSERRRFHRVSKARFGTFYFSCGEARFDLPANGDHGTAYFAFKQEGAFDEVLQRSPIVDIDQLFALSHWIVSPAKSVEEVLDITDPEVKKNLGLDPRLPGTLVRAKTQSFAENAKTAGFNGIVFTLFESQASGAGLALFGKNGRSSPETAGLPSSMIRESPVVGNSHFWERLLDGVATNNYILLLEQLPRDTPVKMR